VALAAAAANDDFPTTMTLQYGCTGSPVDPNRYVTELFHREGHTPKLNKDVKRLDLP
jgi:hypothetical protein